MQPNNKKDVLLNSLKARLTISALLLIMILLPLIGVTLNNAFERQVMDAVENELSAYTYSILAVAEVEDYQLLMPEQLLENQFNLIQSGLYAIITRSSPPRSPNNSPSKQTIAWQSPSLLGLNTTGQWPQPKVGQSTFDSIDIDDERHYIYSFSVNFSGEQDAPLTIHIVQDLVSSQSQLDSFNQQIWLWLGILMIFLIIVQLAWLLWTLRPLQRFKKELLAVESGQQKQLDGEYPNELQVVASQLNSLLANEQNQRKRYRNSLADLAHSLKTPLAVVQSQTDLNHISQEQVAKINQLISHQLKRAQSSAGMPWHVGVKLDTIIPKLVRTLNKIYQEPLIDIQTQVDTHAVFKGDQADIMEIMGNLLDNACKAAYSQVSIQAYIEGSILTIDVEDDGRGVDKALRQQILKRGIRADTYSKGHGIGLAIVNDLVDSYQGTLIISQSATLGGAKFSCQFSG